MLGLKDGLSGWMSSEGTAPLGMPLQSLNGIGTQDGEVQGTAGTQGRVEARGQRGPGMVEAR